MQINRCTLFSRTCYVIKIADSISKNFSSFLRWTIKWQLIWLMCFHLVSSFNESLKQFCGTFDKLSNLWDLNLATKANQWGIRFDIALNCDNVQLETVYFYGTLCHFEFLESFAIWILVTLSVRSVEGASSFLHCWMCQSKK